MSKRLKQWYHFDSIRAAIRVSIRSFDENDARACLSLIIKGYAPEDWMLARVTPCIDQDPGEVAESGMVSMP